MANVTRTRDTHSQELCCCGSATAGNSSRAHTELGRLALPSAPRAVGGRTSVTMKGSLGDPGTSPPGSGKPSACDSALVGCDPRPWVHQSISMRMELIINTCLWTGQAIRSSGYLCGIRRGWSWLAWFVRPPVKCPGNGHTL